MQKALISLLLLPFYTADCHATWDQDFGGHDYYMDVHIWMLIVQLRGALLLTGLNRRWVEIHVWALQRSSDEDGPSIPVSSPSLDTYSWQEGATAGARKRPGGFDVVMDAGHGGSAKGFVPVKVLRWP